MGVTSGASVPEILVRDVLTYLAERGYGDVQPVVSAAGEPAVLAAQRAAPRPQGPQGGRGHQVRHDAGALGPESLH